MGGGHTIPSTHQSTRLLADRPLAIGVCGPLGPRHLQHHRVLNECQWWAATPSFNRHPVGISRNPQHASDHSSTPPHPLQQRKHATTTESSRQWWEAHHQPSGTQWAWPQPRCVQPAAPAPAASWQQAHTTPIQRSTQPNHAGQTEQPNRTNHERTRGRGATVTLWESHPR